MLVVKNNKEVSKFTRDMTVAPLECNDDIVIAIDPSKTNFAMVIGRPDKSLVEILEFSGNNRKVGPVEDTTLFCEELRLYLKQYLSNVHLYVAGIEAAITPHKKGKSDYVFHNANMVLTEIRATVLGFFMDTFGIHIQEVNNWTWKSNQLPEGYRGRDQKYSKLYLRDTDPDNPLCNYYEADATDAYFLFRYLCDSKCSGYTLVCNRSEEPLHPLTLRVYPIGDYLTQTYDEVVYNGLFSIKDNAAYYTNRFNHGVRFDVPVKDLDLDLIYNGTYDIETFPREDEEVTILALCF